MGLLVYAVTLHGTYIYDDVFVALQDRRLTDPSTWGTFWTKDYYYNLDEHAGSVDNLYRPLVLMSFALQAMLHGPGNPLPLHALNILLYAGCCAVVAGLGGLLGGRACAWVAGLAFAVHPVHAEAVCALVGRAELMAMLGVCGALLLHLSSPPSYRRAAGILACLTLGLLSKEQGLLGPAILLAAEPLRRRLCPPAEPTDPHPKAMSPLQVVLLGACFLLSTYIVLREQVLGLRFWWDRAFLDTAVQPLARPDADRTWMPFVLFGNYLRLLVFPTHQSFDYSGAAIGYRVRPGDWQFYLGLLGAVAGPVALVVAVVRRRWEWVVVLVGFALSYGVISNAVSLIGVVFAERLIFLPSVFFCLGVGLLLSRLPKRSTLTAAGTAVVLFAAVHTALYARRWNDRVGLLEYTHRQQPGAIHTRQLLVGEYLARGDLDLAKAMAESATQTLPDYWAVWVEASRVAEARGELDSAERYMVRAFELEPRRIAAALGQLRERIAPRRAAATTQATAGPTTLPSSPSDPAPPKNR